MSGTKFFNGGQLSASTNREVKSCVSLANTEAFETDPIKFVSCQLIGQVSGDATDIVVLPERSATDPDGPFGPTWAPAPTYADGFTGDLSAGIAGIVFTEPGVGWWRLRGATVTGGDCSAALSGLG